MDLFVHAKAKRLKVLENMRLLVLFDDGQVRLIDMNFYIPQHKNFKRLKNQKLFNRAKLSPGGFGIIWNKDIDIDVNSVLKNGKKVDWDDFLISAKNQTI